MATITLETPDNPEGRQQIPIYLYVTVLSSLSIMVGLIWDISWHMSIGRDGLFSAPHLAIYLGGVTAGLFQDTTFSRSQSQELRRRKAGA